MIGQYIVQGLIEVNGSTEDLTAMEQMMFYENGKLHPVKVTVTSSTIVLLWLLVTVLLRICSKHCTIEVWIRFGQE